MVRRLKIYSHHFSILLLTVVITLYKRSLEFIPWNSYGLETAQMLLNKGLVPNELIHPYHGMHLLEE
jgi:hypothetical protein